jgi:hypothetical protein
MIVDTPYYVPNMVIRRDLQTPTVREEISRYSSQYSARLNAHPNDLTVNLIELPDNRRLWRHLPNDLPHQIRSVIVVFVSLGITQKPQEALNLLVTEEHYWALFYMPLYTFPHNFLNVLVQITNEMGLQKNV